MSTTDGKIYNWDLKLAHRFKEEKYGDNSKFVDIKVGYRAEEAKLRPLGDKSKN